MKASEFMAEIDRFVALCFEHTEQKPCCSKGCSHCCDEPLYVASFEFEYMLKGLTEEQLERIKSRITGWVAKATPFFNSGPERRGMCNSHDYRDAAITCPFLENNMCMVYERRPMGCRTYFATGDPNKCKVPHNRTQLIAELPKGHPIEMNAFIGMGFGSGKISMDHLGIFLSNKFLGTNLKSSAYNIA